jgi:hypothetical protein
MKARTPILAVMALGLGFGACNDEGIAPVTGGPGAGRGGAEILHTMSPRLPVDQREDATAALTRDAYAALVDVDRGAVRLMLTTLTRAPRLVTQ